MLRSGLPLLVDGWRSRFDDQYGKLFCTSGPYVMNTWSALRREEAMLPFVLVVLAEKAASI